MSPKLLVKGIVIPPPLKQEGKLNSGRAWSGLHRPMTPKRSQQSTKNENKTTKHFWLRKTPSYFHSGFKTPTRQRDSSNWRLEGGSAWPVASKTESIYLLFNLFAQETSLLMEHLVFIVAQLLPNCTAEEIKTQEVTGQAQPGPSPLGELCSLLRGRDHTPRLWSSGGDL